MLSNAGRDGIAACRSRSKPPRTRSSNIRGDFRFRGQTGSVGLVKEFFQFDPLRTFKANSCCDAQREDHLHDVVGCNRCQQHRAERL